MPWFSMVIFTSSRFLASLFKLKNTKPGWVKKKAFLKSGTVRSGKYMKHLQMSVGSLSPTACWESNVVVG